MQWLTRRGGFLAVAMGISGAACSTPPPKQPPGAPPTPQSITKEEPGGDAADPGEAALRRLLEEPLNRRQDKFRTLGVRLMDHKKWRRVRVWGHPTRTAFRYGDDHHAMAFVWYEEAEGGDSPEACLDAFVARASDTAEAYSTTFDMSPVFEAEAEFLEKPHMVFRIGEGSVSQAFFEDDYAGAAVAYQSWPGTCLIQAFVVKSTEHPELAADVRDRWVKEAAPMFQWLVEEPPEMLTR